MKHVYTVTVFWGDPRSKDFRMREWGYFFKRRDAAATIEKNLTDVSELGYYRYALLGSREEGPLAITVPIQWYEFQWDDEARTFLSAPKIACPEMYAHL